MTTTGAITASSKQAQVIGSFASLISCALNTTDSGVSQPFKSSAVQLPFFISESQDTSAICCTASSLQLRQQESAFFPRPSKPLLQDAAASNLRHPLEVRKSELKGLPVKLLWNLSQSFMSLVDSRLRSSLAALVRQSRGGSQEDNALTRVLVGLLAASSSPINPTTIVTTFRTLAFSERNADGDYILPLVMEAVIDLNILGNIVAVAVEAPGTVLGTFACNAEQAGPAELLKIDIQIDTSALLVSMMAQARSAVRNAVGFATEVASHVLLSSSPSAVSNGSGLQSISSLPSLQPELVATSSACTGSCKQAEPVAPGSEHDLMPPPPARARSSSSLETNDKKVQCSSSLMFNKNNDSWDEKEGKARKLSVSGLSLLTSALSGLQRNPNDDASDHGPKTLSGLKRDYDDSSDYRPDSKKRRATPESDSAADAESSSSSVSSKSTMEQEQTSHNGDDLKDIATRMAKV
jgi:hypothetical protein